MYKKILTGLVLSVLASTAFAENHVFVKPFAAKSFVELPEELRYPEGLSHNPSNGDFYVSTFNVPNAEYNPSPVNSLLRYSRDGELLARSDFSGPTPMVGIRYNPADNHIYVTSLGDITGVGSKILRIQADFDETSPVQVVADIPFLGAPADRSVQNIDGSSHLLRFNTYIRVPNDIIFDRNGGMYVSDSFQGAVFYLADAAECSKPCQLETVLHDGLLATAGFPSFGANGLALNASETTLFIANTGDDRILSYDLSGQTALTVFAEGINGADGLAFDGYGHLWVTANQSDQIIALNSAGQVVANLGSNMGLRLDGSPRGLLFPASLDVIGNRIVVTNMAQIATPMIGDEIEERVQRFTVSELEIPFLMRFQF